jgi:hypothetical protein
MASFFYIDHHGKILSNNSSSVLKNIFVIVTFKS